jgi:uncharacterized membrane-anchored protein YhcB (DUF1043 family)
VSAAILNSQFVQVALPLMLAIITGIWAMMSTNNRRIDDVNRRLDDLKSDMNRRFDEIMKRFDRIETLLTDHDQRITRLEERTSPLTRR